MPSPTTPLVFALSRLDRKPGSTRELAARRHQGIAQPPRSGLGDQGVWTPLGRVLQHQAMPPPGLPDESARNRGPGGPRIGARDGHSPLSPTLGAP